MLRFDKLLLLVYLDEHAIECVDLYSLHENIHIFYLSPEVFNLFPHQKYDYGLAIEARRHLHLHLHKYCESFHITHRNDIISSTFQT